MQQGHMTVQIARIPQCSKIYKQCRMAHVQQAIETYWHVVTLDKQNTAC